VIKTRFYIVFIILLLLFGFILTTLSSFLVSRHSLRSQIKSSEIPLTSGTIYSKIKTDLLAPKLIASVMANDAFLRKWIINGEKDQNQIKNYLKQIKQNYNVSSAFFVSNQTGNYYYPKGIFKKVSPADTRDNWFYNLKKADRLYELNIEADATNNDESTIFFNYKVFDHDDNFIGSTGVGIEVVAVRKIIDDHNLKYKKNIYISDAKGKVILYSAQSLLQGSQITDLPGLHNKKDILLTKAPQVISFEQGMETIHISSRFIPELDWIMIIEQTEQRITENIRVALYINIAMSIIICIGILIILLYILSRYNTRMEQLATTDKLTGSYNRTAFDLYIEILRKESIRSQLVFSLAIFDFDFFKAINDTYGHAAGDQILIKITEIVKNSIRDSDLLFRWGGEEFLILLKNCPLVDAVATMDKIRSTINKTIFYFEDNPITITISAGVTNNNGSENIDVIIKRADALLYEAKRKGRDRTESAVQH
jgi:diguanylate cyclase (GGDEF)-like protein